MVPDTIVLKGQKMKKVLIVLFFLFVSNNTFAKSKEVLQGLTLVCANNMVQTTTQQGDWILFSTISNKIELISCAELSYTLNGDIPQSTNGQKTWVPKSSPDLIWYLLK